jgi:hypothetical protein
MAIDKPQDTSFSFDILGRYGCNTIKEALDSLDPQKHSDAVPFHDIVVGGGSFASIVATRLFNLDASAGRRVLVLEAGPLALPEHVQNLPPNFSPPNKSTVGTVWTSRGSPTARCRSIRAFPAFVLHRWSVALLGRLRSPDQLRRPCYP